MADQTISPLPLVKPKRISDQVLEQLQELIFRGALKPGEKLMPERELAQAMEVSRTTVRDAISKLVEGRKIELEVMTSFIDDQKCGGCKLCITVCPYKAVYFDEEKKICVINEVICRGCGTCSASCPSGASRARHFTDEQIYAEIGGILDV